MLKRLSQSINSYGLVALMVASLLPAFMAKQAVALCFLLIVLVNVKELFHFEHQIYVSLILLFFLPGIVVSLQVNPLQLVRLIPIVFITLLSPLRRSMGSPSLVFKVSVILLVYCIAWQISILLGMPGSLEFRDIFYPYSAPLHPFNCDFRAGPQFCISDTLFFSFGRYRAAGIFFNPNQLSIILIILYATAYGAWMAKNICEARFMHRFILHCWPLSSLVLFAQYLTGSRTGLITFFVFHLCLLLPCAISNNNLSFKRFLRSFPAFKIFGISAVLVVLLGLFSSTFDYIKAGFSAGDSLSVKFQILLNYYSQIPFEAVIFGSGTNRMFDFEFGYFFGFGGLCALLSIVLFYCLLLSRNILLFPLIIVLLLTSFTNSVMYSLMYSVLLIPAFIAPFLSPEIRSSSSV